MTRSMADMLIRLSQSRYQPVQRLGGGRAVLHQGQANKSRARIEAVGLEPRQIAARHDAHAGLLEQPQGNGRIVADLGRIEPDTEAGIGPAIAVTIADDLVGEIELDPVESADLLDMRFVAIGTGRDMLERHRYLRRRDVA